jgi:hypothetical protein
MQRMGKEKGSNGAQQTEGKMKIKEKKEKGTEKWNKMLRFELAFPFMLYAEEHHSPKYCLPSNN